MPKPSGNGIEIEATVQRAPVDGTVIEERAGIGRFARRRSRANVKGIIDSVEKLEFTHRRTRSSATGTCAGCRSKSALEIHQDSNSSST